MITALKLFKLGHVQLNGGQSSDMIAAPASDKQLAMHLDEGVYCQVLSEGIWSQDPDGLQAIITEDNMNASVDMATNEMEVLRYIADEADSGKSPEECLSRTQSRFGNSAFSDADVHSLYNFAVRVPHNLVKNLAELHFSLIPPALLRCPPRHFGAIARIGGQTQDNLCPHSKAGRAYYVRTYVRTYVRCYLFEATYVLV